MVWPLQEASLGVGFGSLDRWVRWTGFAPCASCLMPRASCLMSLSTEAPGLWACYTGKSKHVSMYPVYSSTKNWIEITRNARSWAWLAWLLVFQSCWSLCAWAMVQGPCPMAHSPWPVAMGHGHIDVRKLSNHKTSSRRDTELKIWSSEPEHLKETHFDVEACPTPPKSAGNTEKLISKTENFSEIKIGVEKTKEANHPKRALQVSPRSWLQYVRGVNGRSSSSPSRLKPPERDSRSVNNLLMACHERVLGLSSMESKAALDLCGCLSAFPPTPVLDLYAGRAYERVRNFLRVWNWVRVREFRA